MEIRSISKSLRPSSSGMCMTNQSTDENDADGIQISIEYCSACRWMLRASWIASELLTTFANEPKLASVTMVNKSPPLSEGGIFRISASSSSSKGDQKNSVLLWDRKTQGRFPESKEVKQLVRDCVNPDEDLGHSDNRQPSEADGSNAKGDDCIECKEEQQEKGKPLQTGSGAEMTSEEPTDPSSMIPSIFYKQDHISIDYSTGTSIDSEENEMYRAAHYANELLSMIYKRNAWWKEMQLQGDVSKGIGEKDAPAAIDSVTLIPNRLETEILRVKLNDDKVIFDESDPTVSTVIADGAHLRNIVKDILLNNGISDVTNDEEVVVEMMDDDEAEEARKYFGVF
eukprot:CAMPEP_0183720424 /NCGR_PEP_ID=MMETSP0737-20130205/13040_1 /TAXON_ID=385413 /ORGANISM="Thalassiosira miniscula, Strain CCMP1093" /LENGTH=341 /DNA_ID=CAMNT_0025950281 /DNA_START=242 /DNA_END=1267 /DNA_ORIENTATION=+